MKRQIQRLAVLAVSTAPVLAQADECTAATDLGTGPTTATFDTNVCVDTNAQATTSLEQQCTSLTEDVWFKYTAQTTGLASFDTCNNATFDTEIGVWEGADCANLTPLGCNDDNGGLGCTGNTSFLDNVSVTAGQTYYIQLGYWSNSGGVWGAGTLTISEFPDPCLVLMDDAFEPNDICTAPSPVGPGAYTGLFTLRGDEDFYSITIPAGEIMTFDVTNDLNADIDLNVFDAGCNLLSASTSDSIMWSNLGATPITVVVEAYVDATSANNCTNYDAAIALAPDPCAVLPADMFEDNDSCQSPSALAPNMYSGLSCALADPDFYEMTLAGNEILDFDIVDTAAEDLDLRLYDDQCNLIQDFNTDGLTYSNNTNSSVTVIVEVYVDPAFAGSGCLNYDLTAAVMIDPCVALMDDAFEPNDTCLAPSTLAAGSYPGLFSIRGDEDFYSIVIQPGDIMDFDVTNDLNADIDLNLFDDTCGLLASSTTDSISYSNLGAAPITVIVEAYVDTISANSCTNYDVDVTMTPDPCVALGSDAFEDNDDCPTALPLGDGLYSGLTVFESDNDHYAVTLPAGGTLNATIFFSDVTADVDLYLWDPAIACSTAIAGTGTGSGALDVGFSTSDNEDVTFTNTSGAELSLILEVDMFTAGGCNSYDLEIQGAGPIGPVTIGTNYCPAELNSTGQTGVMSAMGFTSAAANDVTLMASSVAPSQFGIFIVSAQDGFIPFAGGTSNGNLCLSGAIGRYQGPGQIQPTGPTGEFALSIDLTSIPQANGGVAVQAGDSWYFQGWHRDTGGAGSNFTDGLQIDFN